MPDVGADRVGIASTLPESQHDRYKPTNRGLSEACQIRESFQFMSRRDELLRECNKLRNKLPADRVRLYEYVDSGDRGARFLGLVEIGGIYANFMKLELPLAADWYSQKTYYMRRHGEPILYPDTAPDPKPPRFHPTAFWRERIPEKWIDILLMDGSRIVGKISADNILNRNRMLPNSAGHCRTELERIVSCLSERVPEPSPAAMVEAHRRRVLLNDLTEILQNMVCVLDLDRARVYEYNLATDRFEARAEVGGTLDPMLTSLKCSFGLTHTREDPISFLTYELRQPAVYRRGEVAEFKGPHGVSEHITIVFGCDTQVGSEDLMCLMDVPIVLEDRILGKITADYLIRDPKGDAEPESGEVGRKGMLDRLLDERRPEIDYFSAMASHAILRSHTIPTRLGWIDRFASAYKGLSERQVTVMVAIASALVGGAAQGLIRSFFGD